MKKLFFIVCAVLLGGSSFAQDTISLGTLTGSGSTNVLLSTSTTNNRYSRTMSLYTATEMLAAGATAGTITSLAWDKSGTGEYTTNDAYIKVYLRHIADSVWSTSPVPDWNAQTLGARQVFTSSTYSLPVGVGWAWVPFDSAFTWNGTDNVVVMVEWDRASAPTGAINWGRSTNANMNATRVGSASLAALVMLVNANRPLVRFAFGTSSPPATVSSVAVSTQGGAPATISTNMGTLQLQTTVLPANANQQVSWSVQPVTGDATISATGLLTAVSNGTVWAKARSVQDTTKADSLLVTITNQTVIISAVVVSTVNNLPAVINAPSGSLALQAAVLPAQASQAVTWSIVQGAAFADISQQGVVSALANGSVQVRARSVADTNIFGTLTVTISNQQSSVETNFKSPMQLYPNPLTADGQLRIVFDEADFRQDGMIEIFTAAGKLLKRVETPAAQFGISLANVPSGIYLVRYRDEVKMAYRQLIKP